MQSLDSKIISPSDAISLLESYQTIVVAHASGEPRHFYEQIHLRAPNLIQSTVYGANPSQDYPCFNLQGLKGHIDFDLAFLNVSVRQAKNPEHVSYIPCHMSRWAEHMRRSATIKRSAVGKATDGQVIDVFWGSCSLPNEDGLVSLGLNAVYEAELIHKAKMIILEMNPNMPFTYGATLIPLSKIDHVLLQDKPPPAHNSAAPSAEDLKIGTFVAELVKDDSTIQLGIGAIPNAIGKALTNHKNLGVHTEMINDAIMSLRLAGAINGSAKTLWKDKIIGAFVYGSSELYKFVDKNAEIELHPASTVNERATIAKNYKMTSINTAVEVDLTGQVCSESIGHGEITGTGGASDTHVGAQYSPGGRGIIALRSTTKDGQRSKIVFSLATGAKVSIHRNDVDTVITEYGIAELSGRNVRERVTALIGIAHPKFREQLAFEAKKYRYI